MAGRKTTKGGDGTPPQGIATADVFFGIFGMKRKKMCLDCKHIVMSPCADELPFCWKIRKYKSWKSNVCKYFKED